MKSNNVIQEKSFQFALRAIKLNHYLVERKEFDMASQILGSGTSIGANVEEAVGAQSTKDFLSKISIAYKEARETHYWLRLLTESEILGSRLGGSLMNDVDELLRILGSIQRSVKTRIRNS